MKTIRAKAGTWPWLSGRGRAARLGWGLLIVLVAAALRFPWLEADGGNAGFSSYGVFTTDEGYNTSGGRLAYLTGKFFDPELLEPIVFTASWGMSILNYVGYLVGGLTFGAARLPTMWAAVMGWFLAYWLASRVTLPAIAGLLTLLLSCNPLSLTYERIHNTDVVVGALVVLAYALVTDHRLGRTLVAGVVFGFALAVKTTTLGLAPLVVLAIVAQGRGTLRRFVGFGVACGVAFGVLWWWRQATIAAAGGPDNDLVARTLLPVSSIISFNVNEWFRALAIFPRWPISFQMGPFVVWTLFLPVWLVGSQWSRTGRICSRQTAMGWGILIYLALLATQAQAPLRRVAPYVMYFMPVLLVWGRAAVLRRGGHSRHTAVVLIFALAVMCFLYWCPRALTPAGLQTDFYNEYVLPARNAWTLSWPFLIAALLVSGAAFGYGLNARAQPRRWLLVAGAALMATWVFFCNYTVAVQAVRGGFAHTQFFFQLSVGVFVWLLLFGRQGRWPIWYVGLGLLYLGTGLANDHWRAAWRDQMTRHYVERDAARQLAQALPPDAMVVGRRSTTLLRATRCRLGLVAPIWKPAEYFADVERLLTKHPTQPVYLLLDSDQTAPGAVAYLQQPDGPFQTQLVTRLQQYADGGPQLVPLYVLEIRRRQPGGPG